MLNMKYNSLIQHFKTDDLKLIKYIFKEDKSHILYTNSVDSENELRLLLNQIFQRTIQVYIK